MENKVNQIASETNTYKKKEEISKAMPDPGILVGGIVVGLVIWIIIGEIHKADIEDDFLYLDFDNLFSYFTIVGICILILVLLSCAKLLGIIAKNQVELMEHFGCSNSNQQPEGTAHIETKEDNKIAKLKELRDAGIISQDEYEAQISKLQ